MNPATAPGPGPLTMASPATTTRSRSGVAPGIGKIASRLTCTSTAATSTAPRTSGGQTRLIGGPPRARAPVRGGRAGPPSARPGPRRQDRATRSPRTGRAPRSARSSRSCSLTSRSTPTGTPGTNGRPPGDPNVTTASPSAIGSSGSRSSNVDHVGAGLESATAGDPELRRPGQPDADLRVRIDQQLDRRGRRRDRADAADQAIACDHGHVDLDAVGRADVDRDGPLGGLRRADRDDLRGHGRVLARPPPGRAARRARRLAGRSTSEVRTCARKRAISASSAPIRASRAAAPSAARSRSGWASDAERGLHRRHRAGHCAPGRVHG